MQKPAVKMVAATALAVGSSACTSVPASPSPQPRPVQTEQPAPSGAWQIVKAPPPVHSAQPAPSEPRQLVQAADVDSKMRVPNVDSTPVVKIDTPPQLVTFPGGDPQVVAASEDAVLVVSGTERELELALFDAATLNSIGDRRHIVAAV